jgi:hypothetical protein
MMNTEAHINLPPIGSTGTRVIDRPLMNLGFTSGLGLDMKQHYQITIYQGHFYEYLPAEQPNHTGVIVPEPDYDQLLTYAALCGAQPLHFYRNHQFFWIDRRYLDQFRQQLDLIHHRYTGHTQ